MIRGNTVGTTMPRANFDQTDARKADYINGREKILTRDELDSSIELALSIAKESGAFDGKDGYTPKKNVDYFDGKDGYTPKKNVDYFDGKDGVGISLIEQEVAVGDEGQQTIYITLTNGEEHTFYVYNGSKGEKGDTPQKGKDYFTDADKTEMVNAVLSALPVYNGEVVAV